jgi:predicted Mrr-cat superfamily restriction endonuclease
VARYWVIAPYLSTEQEAFQQVWEYDLRNGVIAIGWRELGDVSELTEDQLKARIREVYGDRNLTLSFNMLWRFYHVVEPGDMVIARRGRKTIAAVGSVIARAFYNEEMGRERGGSSKEGSYPNFISVQWQNEGRNKEFPTQAFAMQTLYEIPEDKFRSTDKWGRTGRGKRRRRTTCRIRS